MSAQDNLSSEQYSLILNKGDDSHLVEAYKGKHGPVGFIEWDANSGEVKDIRVAPEHQRKGLATALWKEANNSGLIKPVHSQALSEQGAAWKKSLR